jgi:hypothetical protein
MVDGLCRNYMNKTGFVLTPTENAFLDYSLYSSPFKLDIIVHITTGNVRTKEVLLFFIKTI